MGGRRAERIEAVVDQVAAAVFAAAVGYAAFGLMSGVYLSAGAAAVAYLLSARLLRTVAAENRHFVVADFAIPAIDAPTDELLLTERAELLLTEAVELLLTEPVELLLTDADRLRPASPHAPLELVLDDIVSELPPDSRVVRLFDPTAMPTPGQLNARIEQHLGEETSPIAPPDASQALYDALAELRRSLR